MNERATMPPTALIHTLRALRGRSMPLSPAARARAHISHKATQIDSTLTMTLDNR